MIYNKCTPLRLSHSFVSFPLATTPPPPTAHNMKNLMWRPQCEKCIFPPCALLLCLPIIGLRVLSLPPPPRRSLCARWAGCFRQSELCCIHNEARPASYSSSRSPTASGWTERISLVIHLFSFFSSFFARRCRSFAFLLRRERLRVAGYWNLLSGLCKQVLPFPPAVHWELLPSVDVHRLALPSFHLSGHVVQMGGRRTTACTDRAGWQVLVVMPGEWECLGGHPACCGGGPAVFIAQL